MAKRKRSIFGDDAECNLKEENNNSDESITIDLPEKRAQGLPLVEPELLGQRAPLGFNTPPGRLVLGTPRLLAVGFFSRPQIENCLVALLVVDRQRVDDDVGVC